MRCCAGSVYYVVQIQPRNHALDDANYAAPTRQHELDHTDHTDHTDQEYVCPERSGSSSGNRLPICPVCAAFLRYSHACVPAHRDFLGCVTSTAIPPAKYLIQTSRLLWTVPVLLELREGARRHSRHVRTVTCSSAPIYLGRTQAIRGFIGCSASCPSCPVSPVPLLSWP